jgi:hypothetical protein
LMDSKSESTEDELTIVVSGGELKPSQLQICIPASNRTQSCCSGLL